MVKNYIKLIDVIDGWGCFLVCYRCECFIFGEIEFYFVYVSCDLVVWEEVYGDIEVGIGYFY